MLFDEWAGTDFGFRSSPWLPCTARDGLCIVSARLFGATTSCHHAMTNWVVLRDRGSRVTTETTHHRSPKVKVLRALSLQGTCNHLWAVRDPVHLERAHAQMVTDESR